MITFLFISSEECRRPLTQEGFSRRLSEIQRGAAGTKDVQKKSIALWKMENIGAAFLRNAQPGQTLDDPDLPVEILPIAHCGIGIAAVELADFRAARVIELIERFSNPAYKRFAYENIGAMLGVYDRDFFTLLAKSLAMAGLLPIASLHPPPHRSYLEHFDAEARRLISVGYGRMLYFKQSTLTDAVRLARSADCFDFGACIQGMAFGYSMVNGSDLHRAWKTGEGIRDSQVRKHFLDGLVFALMFWEWMAPGSLDSLSLQTDFEVTLIRAAHKGVKAGRARGALRAFAVE